VKVSIEYSSELISRLNEISPIHDGSELVAFAKLHDEGSKNQDLIKAATLYLYAFYNGSASAKHRLIEMGYCPDYFVEIVNLTENDFLESKEILNLVSKTTGDHYFEKGGLRALITSSFLFVDAIAAVGVSIFNNYTIGLEYDLSIALCKTAADSLVGQGIAALIVGNHYFGLQEFDDSVKYFEKAVEKDNADAMYSLSGFYFNGIGHIERNTNKAKELLLRSAKLGNQKAKSVLDRFFS